MKLILTKLAGASLLCFVAVSAMGQESQDARVLIQEAFALQQQGDLSGAAEAYRAFLKLRPDEVGAHSNLGVVLVKLGRYNEAVAEYQAAQKLAPGDVRIGVNLGLAFVKGGRLAEAAKTFEALHGQAPDEPKITTLLADTQLQAGNEDRVIELLQPLAESHIDDLSIAYMLGMAFLRKQRINESQVYLDRIFKSGDTAEARYLMGARLFEMGNFPAAVEKLAAAISLNPNLQGVESLHGQALLSTGDPDGAVAAFRKELEGNANDFPANLGLGQILLMRKQYNDARPVLERALTLRPESADALLANGELLLAGRQYQAARVRLEEARRLAAGSVEVHRDLAAAYDGLKLGREAARERAEAAKLEAQQEAANMAVKVNEPAPEFSLPSLNGDKNVSLASFRDKSPVALVFGSYSCPNFRSAASSLRDLAKQYGDRVPFLMVYIREAHTGETWESSRNEREGVHMQPAKDMAEKQDHATFCMRTLHLAFPAVVDGMDGAVEKAYAAWPSLALVVGKDGRVVYATRLSELDYSAGKMEGALRSALTHK